MGNASRKTRPPGASTVHPHVHGERTNPMLHGSLSFGSSPRTWGTLTLVGTTQSIFRFIPTYMGNAGLPRQLPLPSPVHPHVHGERLCRACHSPNYYGSSPRTWGTRREGSPADGRDRFIPTYMGNAAGGDRDIRMHTVHPHVHGERAPRNTECRFSSGSSPRTWGTHADVGETEPETRFIPTYMGNAAGSCIETRRSPVHPHVHGERTGNSPGGIRKGGSSPRTWGTLLRVEWFCPGRRFIPTYMGNA